MANGRQDPQEFDPENPIVRAMLDSTGVDDTLFSAFGRPRYLTAARRGVPGTAGQYFPGPDSMTLRPVVGVGGGPDQAFMESILAHEVGHRLLDSLRRLEPSDLRGGEGADIRELFKDVSSDRDYVQRVAEGDPHEAFAEAFESGVGSVREDDVRGLQGPPRAAAEYVLNQPIYRTHPINRRRMRRAMGGMQRSAAQDATAIHKAMGLTEGVPDFLAGGQ